MSETRTEFGVRYEWTDGHVEIHPKDDRYEAETRTRNRNFSREDDGTGPAASVVIRTVTTTAWAELA